MCGKRGGKRMCGERGGAGGVDTSMCTRDKLKIDRNKLHGHVTECGIKIFVSALALIL
jgi:hypothetical protein